MRIRLQPAVSILTFVKCSMMIKPTICVLFVLLLPAFCQSQELFLFQGTLQPFRQTITNSYSGEQVVLDFTEANVNTGQYFGDSTSDSNTIFMTEHSDVLLLRDGSGNQVLDHIQRFLAGSGSDVIQLADPDILLGNATVVGAAGGDVVWTNAGNDSLFGVGGDDHLVAGPGDDLLSGGDGIDYLNGGTGSDRYFYEINHGTNGNSTDRIRDDADGAFDFIEIDILDGVSFDSDGLSFEVIGSDLKISHELLGEIFIEDQVLGNGAGLDELRVSTGEVFNLRSVPEPSAIVLFGMCGCVLGMHRRSRHVAVRR